MMTTAGPSPPGRGYVDWITTLTHGVLPRLERETAAARGARAFDYERENVTRMLWAPRGSPITTARCSPARAGVIARDECLGELGTSIAERYRARRDGS